MKAYGRVEVYLHAVNLVTAGSSNLLCFFIYTTTHCSLKAYCAILVRRSNFRHQASPRVSPREGTQLWGEKFPVILPKMPTSTLHLRIFYMP